ncbi:DUF506 family protein [Rhynchospora pubera]|uniref:DUF506 family protein n=1 Tax=Rhynchospora pubera TaxID=906938 RepID=A0AAV8APE3_9POAL|nr:DUF506 family protein [Rhynchospora pubera]KAJ4753154.1 DUF506 family protein [Rhynchospora pubera]
MGVRYKKAVLALDETAKARLWGPFGGESFTSSSSDESAELANLVDSFYDSDYERRDGDEIEAESDGEELIEMLDATLDEIGNDLEVDRIRTEVERAIRVAGSGPDSRFKKRVVTLLQQRGFDAGLCKSSWEQSEGLPTGYHKYIDVITSDKSRYIIETNLASYFEIARPSDDYMRLMKRLPTLFIGRPDHLKSVVRVMSNAAIESIKTAGMHVPPWRRKEFVLAKWFSSHKRIINFRGDKMEIGTRVKEVK